MNIQESITQFLREIGAKKSQNTQRTYSNGINRLMEYFISENLSPSSNVSCLTTNLFIGYPVFLSQKAYSKKTIGLYTSSVRSFYKWLIIQDVLQPSQRDALRFEMVYKDANQKREAKLPRWPGKNDVQKMILAVKEMNEPSPRIERDVAIVEFLASTGCRNFEITNLKIKSVDMNQRSAIVIGKGNKERKVFFSIAAKDALLAYWNERGHNFPEAYVFCRHDKGAGKKMKGLTTATIRNVVNAIAKLAGINTFTPHYFRHGFAIKALRETGNLAMVQDFLGHADPAATRVYAKIYPDELRDAHHKIFD